MDTFELIRVIVEAILGIIQVVIGALGIAILILYTMATAVLAFVAYFSLTEQRKLIAAQKDEAIARKEEMKIRLLGEISNQIYRFDMLLVENEELANLATSILKNKIKNSEKTSYPNMNRTPFYFQSLFQFYETVFFYKNKGYLEEQQWISWDLQITGLTKLHLFKEWWDNPKRSQYTESFTEYIKEKMS